jgi:hypothetical protein
MVTPMPSTFETWMAAAGPGPDPADLLRASLQEGDAAGAAWRAWLGRHERPERALLDPRHGGKRLLGLLLRSAGRNHLEIEPVLLTLLRTHYAAEVARYEFCRGVYADVFDRLAAARISAVVLKGVALAHTVYPEPALRHCHDLDVWIREHRLLHAADALLAAGYRHRFREAGARPWHIELRHPSGLPVTLHASPWRAPLWGDRVEAMWENAEPREVAGREVKVLRAADALVHVALHALYAGRRRALAGRLDGWHLWMAAPVSDPQALEPAATPDAAAPVAFLLKALRDELAAPVPPETLKPLETAAARPDPAVLALARWSHWETGLGRTLDFPRLPGGGKTKVMILRGFVWPDADYVRWAYRIHEKGFTPVLQWIHLARQALVRAAGFAGWLVRRLRGRAG